MPLNAADTRRLDEITNEICQIEQRLAVGHGLGDSHSSQGISATFNNNTEWRNRLSLLRNMRNRLEAVRDNLPLPPIAGTNLSTYLPTVARQWGWGGQPGTF